MSSWYLPFSWRSPLYCLFMLRRQTFRNETMWSTEIIKDAVNVNASQLWTGVYPCCYVILALGNAPGKVCVFETRFNWRRRLSGIGLLLSMTAKLEPTEIIMRCLSSTELITWLWWFVLLFAGLDTNSQNAPEWMGESPGKKLLMAKNLMGKLKCPMIQASYIFAQWHFCLHCINRICIKSITLRGKPNDDESWRELERDKELEVGEHAVGRWRSRPAAAAAARWWFVFEALRC